MKKILFIILLALACPTADAQHPGLSNKVAQGVEAARKRRQQQQQQEAAAAQKAAAVQQQAAAAVSNQQAAAAQMAATDYTQTLAAEHSVQPDVQSQSGPDLSRVTQKVIYDSKNGNTATTVNAEQTAQSTDQSSNQNTSGEQQENNGQNSGSPLYTVGHNGRQPRPEDAKKFVAVTTQQQNARPPRSKGVPGKGNPAKVTSKKAEAASNEAVATIHPQLPIGYLQVGQEGNILEVYASYQYLENNPKLKDGRSFCIQRIGNTALHKIVEGYQGDNGQCSYIGPTRKREK